MDLKKGFLRARASGAPLVAILTPDQGATVQLLLQYADEDGKAPVARWDIMRGVMPLTPTAQKAVADMMAAGQKPSEMTNPSEFLSAALGFAKDGILVMLNAHRYVGRDVNGAEAVWQGVANLRDKYKADGRQLVLLAPEIVFPAELASDVVVLEEELPTDPVLKGVVEDQFKAAGLEAPDTETGAKAVDAVRGLSAFQAEQIVAMSLTRVGLDQDLLWLRKKATIEQTRGLEVFRGGETFADIGGLDQIKGFMASLFAGGRRPRLLVQMEEIEKMVAGSGSTGPGDSSGVAQDALSVILREMEDEDWTGLIAVGGPGTGKSLVSKATAATYDVMAIRFDLGAMRGSYVGQSEQAIRQAMRVIKSIAGPSGAFFVATCNGVMELRPELRRRFRMGLWYFDLPTEEERKAIWKINLTRYAIKKQAVPDEAGLTGADIRNICDIAVRLGVTLAEARQYIVPVSKSSPEAIEFLRTLAHARFLSASYPGTYLKQDEDAEEPVSRKIRLEREQDGKLPPGGNAYL